MFVCICKAVSQHAVGEAIAKGASTVEAVSNLTGACTDCGSCRKTLQRELSRAGRDYRSAPACDRAASAATAE